MKIVIGAVILIIILIVLISKIRINLLIIKDGEDDHIKVNVRTLYGLIKLEKRIPFIDIIDSRENIIEALINTEAEVANIDIPVGEKKDKVLLSIEELKKIKRRLEQLLKTYDKTISYLRRKLFFEKLLWTTKLGTNDAAETAILTGIAWGFKGCILSILSSKVRINKIGIDISPIYDSMELKTSFNCIISLKIGHIIIACIKLILIKIKLEVGERIEHTSH